jgi:hypothetical protein
MPIDYIEHHKRTGDTYGTIHPDWPKVQRRFKLYVIGHEPNEEDGWRYKLRFVDRKYQDSDGFPVDAIAAGNSWAEAFERAGAWAAEALTTDHCIF